jgi:error-prone DNA polymerase
MNYADLQVTTHYSFLRGASSPEDLFSAAASLGIGALGIVDRNSLAGIVRAHEAAKATGVRLIVGCRLDLRCGTSLLVYPTDRAAYGRLCRLLTVGKTRAGKGACHLDWPDVEAWQEGLLAILLPDDLTRELPGELIRLRRIFGDRAYCALTRRFLPDEAWPWDAPRPLPHWHRWSETRTTDARPQSD